MDQVKAFARAAAKHVFWIGCGLILAGSMATWYVARQSLHKEFEKNQGDIKAKYTTVSGLQKKQDPPNEKSHRGDGQTAEQHADPGAEGVGVSVLPAGHDSALADGPARRFCDSRPPFEAHRSQGGLPHASQPGIEGGLPPPLCRVRRQPAAATGGRRRNPVASRQGDRRRHARHDGRKYRPDTGRGTEAGSAEAARSSSGSREIKPDWCRPTSIGPSSRKACRPRCKSCTLRRTCGF